MLHFQIKAGKKLLPCQIYFVTYVYPAINPSFPRMAKKQYPPLGKHQTATSYLCQEARKKKKKSNDDSSTRSKKSTQRYWHQGKRSGSGFQLCHQHTEQSKLVGPGFPPLYNHMFFLFHRCIPNEGTNEETFT